MPGFVCGRCGRLFASLDACPECGNTANRLGISNLVDVAVGLALRKGATVTFQQDGGDAALPITATRRPPAPSAP